MLVEGVWIAVLRSPNCRIPGLKYITSKLGRVAVEDDNDEEDNFWEEGSNNNKLSSKTIPAEITEPVSSCSPSSVKKMPQKDPEIKDSLK